MCVGAAVLLLNSLSRASVTCCAVVYHDGSHDITPHPTTHTPLHRTSTAIARRHQSRNHYSKSSTPTSNLLVSVCLFFFIVLFLVCYLFIICLLLREVGKCERTSRATANNSRASSRSGHCGASGADARVPFHQSSRRHRGKVEECPRETTTEGEKARRGTTLRTTCTHADTRTRIKIL